VGEIHTENAVGLTLRYDDISNGLYRTTELVRTATVREDDVGQLGGGVWGESWLRLSRKMRLNLGLRIDYYDADVNAFRPVNSGSASEWMLNPKATLVWDPSPSVELYLNAGSGFHSNDARGTTIRVDPVTGQPVDRVDPLVRATGIDLGFRAYSRSGYHTTASLFWLELDSELIFVGDAGATEASRPSRRVGIEWTNFWQVLEHVGLDLDMTVTDAEFTDGDPAGSAIPGAIETTIATGVRVIDVGRWSGALRLRYLSGGPLIEDGSVTWGPTVMLNGRVGFRVSERITLALDAFNLLDREDDDIAYFYASRLPDEPAEGVEDVHFHPMEKPSVRVSLVWRY
jgi:outer membrane receptor protein involved in Fe transport